MRYFKVADGVPQLRVRGAGVPGSAAPAVRNLPVRVRNRLGDIPGSNGAPGSPLAPYSENLMYGDSATGQISAPLPIGVSPIADGSQAGMLSSPNAESDRDWYNPTTFSTVAIIADLIGGSGNIGGVGINVVATPALQLNYKRNCLIVQNNSSATTPDTAPTFYLDFNKQPVIGGSLALPPGLGLLFDYVVPRDALYIVYGAFSNAGSTVIITGAIVQGTYSPPANS